MSMELGALIGAFLLILGMGGGVIRSYMALSERIRVLEVLFEVFGRRAARSIHSPTDHYGIDALLDKYMDRYYELSMEEWRQLYDRVKVISRDGETPKHLIFAVDMLLLVCMHKLGIAPPRRKCNA